MDTLSSLTPLTILQQAFRMWRKNLLAVVAIYSPTVFLTHALKFYGMGPRLFSFYAGAGGAIACLVIVYAAVFILNSFIVLIVLHYFFNGAQGCVFFREAFNEAKRRSADYFKALLLYNGLVFFLIGFSAYFFSVGKKYFGPIAASGMHMPVLLATSTMTVVLLIAACWYGFFFSLAPLISAFEQKGALASLSLSKSRIKCCPWRYLTVFLILLGLYFFIGVALYALMAALSVGKGVLGWIDPVMMAVWMPLFLAAWVLSYQKMTQVKLP